MSVKRNKLIVLCATQRCGSTMIVEDFRNSGVLGKPEEYFIPWEPSKKSNWLQYFDSILKSSMTENGVSAIKVMANQLNSIEMCLRDTGIDHGGEDIIFPRVRSLFKDAIFIRIKRDGVVRQAISRVIAKSTGVNHALKDSNAEFRPGNLLKGGQDYNQKIQYSRIELDKEVINISKESLLWDEVLASWGVHSPLELHYEQVCRAYPSYLNRVSNYTGIDINISSLPEDRNIKRLSNSKNDEFAVEYLSELFEENEKL